MSDNTIYKSRIADILLEDKLDAMGAVLIEGPKACGKTTTAGKLANYLRKKNSKNPLLVACDIYRPAAIEQLQTIGKQLNIPVYSEGKKPVKTRTPQISQIRNLFWDHRII